MSFAEPCKYREHDILRGKRNFFCNKLVKEIFQFTLKKMMKFNQFHLYRVARFYLSLHDAIGSVYKNFDGSI